MLCSTLPLQSFSKMRSIARWNVLPDVSMPNGALLNVMRPCDSVVNAKYFLSDSLTRICQYPQHRSNILSSLARPILSKRTLILGSG